MLLALLHKKSFSSFVGSSVCSNLFGFGISVCCPCFEFFFLALNLFFGMCVCVLGLCFYYKLLPLLPSRFLCMVLTIPSVC